MFETESSGTGLITRLDEECLRSAVNQLLRDDAPLVDLDLREASRTRFFAPVSLRLVGKNLPPFSAFAHDISPLGIGLLHVMPVEPGETIATIARPGRRRLSLRTQIVWCKPYGDDWYRSGGRFLQVVEA